MYYRYYENTDRRPSHFGIRTKTHKLIYYEGLKGGPATKRWEFYDLVQDPGETQSAYDDTMNWPKISILKKQLVDLQQEVGDKP